MLTKFKFGNVVPDKSTLIVLAVFAACLIILLTTHLFNRETDRQPLQPAIPSDQKSNNIETGNANRPARSDPTSDTGQPARSTPA